MSSIKMTETSPITQVKQDGTNITGKNSLLASNQSSVKINELKQKINSGEYQVDFNKLAEKIAPKILTKE